MSSPNPPRTPQRTALEQSIETALERVLPAVLKPVLDRIEKLEKVDEKVIVRLDTKSGQYQDLAKGVRESKSEIKTEVKETADASVARDEAIVAELRAVNVRLDGVEKSIVAPTQAAAGAQLAATQSKAVTSVVADDTTTIIAKQKSAQTMAWVRMVLTVTVTPALVAAIAAFSSHC